MNRHPRFPHRVLPLLLLIASIAVASPAAGVARIAMLSARAHDLDLGSIPACSEKRGTVSIENDGSEVVVIVGVSVSGSPMFDIELPKLPDTLMPGERLDIAVRFAPSAAGAYRMTIRFDVRELLGVTPVLRDGKPPEAIVTGDAYAITASARIRRDYRGPAGTRFAAAVELDDDVSDARINSLSITIRYRGSVVDMQDSANGPMFPSLTEGTLLDGWSVAAFPAVIDPNNGSVEVAMFEFRAPSGAFLSGTGALIEVPFLIVDGPPDSTELGLLIETSSGAACASFDAGAGLARRIGDGTSGITDIRITNDATTRDLDIDFVLDVDASLRIELYDILGRLVTTAVDGYLMSGPAHTTIETDGLALGEYYVRLVSGSSDRVVKVIIVP
jgi:hypothetical protein